MADWMTFGMSREEIRVLLDRNVARAAETRKRTEARRAAEQAAAARKQTRSSATPSQNAKPAKPRIGHRMRELADIVSAVPGISKADALRAAGLPTHGLGSGRELDRAIAAGLIIVEHERVNLCRLFATEGDRRRWHLARKLMMPGIPAGRVAGIRAEITALDAERAATWSTHSRPGLEQKIQ